MDLNISFEFFPPKTTDAAATLQHTAQQLAQFNPDFFSVTFGAGGSTRTKTAETVFALQQHTHVNTAPHISCIGSTQENILELLELYKNNQITQLVVLRGDYPSGSVGPAGEFRYANELVSFIREHSKQQFHIHVAAYLEFHPEAKNSAVDFEHFRQKIAAGANDALTQYFFNADAYYFFLELCAKHQITTPIIPGIMPIHNIAGLKRFSNICGAEIPLWLRKRLEVYADDEPSLHQFGIEVITQLCESLQQYGAPGFHFYTLNKAEPTLTICRNLFGNSTLLTTIPSE